MCLLEHSSRPYGSTPEAKLETRVVSWSQADWGTSDLWIMENHPSCLLHSGKQFARGAALLGENAHSGV